MHHLVNRRLFFIFVSFCLFSIDVKTSAFNLPISEHVSDDCNEFKCDLNLKCKKDSSPKRLNGTCCHVCVCDKCPDLNYEICSNGFTAVKQAKLEDECCEILACISNADQDDLVISVEKFNNQNEDDEKRKQSNRNEYTLSNSNDYIINSLSDNSEDLEEESDESYVIDDNETNQHIQDPMCLDYKCSDEKYKYYKHHSKCPKDSQAFDVNLIEKQCCNVEKYCSCNECPDKSEMIEWCKLAGNNFDAVVVQKAEHLPGKCCDVHICHSPNFTCNLNGVFYPHNSNWKLNSCTDCVCEMGHIKCNKISCPVLECEVKQSLTSECCPICTGECLAVNDKIYKANETWREDDDCIECKCVDGKKMCIAESCSPLDCSNPVKIPGVCCPTCPNQKQDTNRGYLKYPPHCRSKAHTKCNTTCQYGYQLDGNRCPTCICSNSPVNKCSFDCDPDMAFMPLNDRLCDCRKNCPNLKCDLTCSNGYLKNSEGCDTCECKVKKNNCTESIDNDKLWSDGCNRQCTCRQGHQYCSLISCKKLECSNPIYLKDSCCPTCPDEHDVTVKQTNITACFSPRSGQIYLENDSWQIDKCTNCTCKNGLVLCEVNECQAVTCLNPILNKDECCPYCTNSNETSIETKPFKKYWSCFDSNDVKRPHGSKWKENDCLNCICNNGERKCFNMQEHCRKLDCIDTIRKKGECCPYCLDSISSPFILSLLNNLTLLKDVTQNHRKHNAVSNYILSFLVIMVVILVILVIVLLFKVLGINPKASRRSSNKKSQLTKENLKNRNENDLRTLKTKSNNNYTLGNVTIPLRENDNMASLITNRDFMPLLLSCDNNSNNQIGNLNTNTSSELSSESFNNDESSKSTIISTDETILKSSTNQSQNRIICYL